MGKSNRKKGEPTKRELNTGIRMAQAIETKQRQEYFANQKIVEDWIRKVAAKDPEIVAKYGKKLELEEDND